MVSTRNVSDKISKQSHARWLGSFCAYKLTTTAEKMA